MCWSPVRSVRDFNCFNAVTGQRGEFLIIGRGNVIISLANCSFLDHLIPMTALKLVKIAHKGLRWFK